MQKYEDEIEIDSENKNQNQQQYVTPQKNKEQQSESEVTHTQITEKQFYTIDEVYQIIGHKGKYQKRTAFLFSFFFLVTTIVLVTPPFMFQLPQFVCPGDDGEERACYEDDGACLDTAKIHKDSQFSITKEYKLYCDERETRDTGESLIYIGCAIGLLIFNQLADIKGRKITIQIAWVVFTIGAFLFSMIDHMDTIMIGIFLMGFGGMPAITIQIVYLNEISTGKFRQTMIICMYIMWGVTEILILPITEITQDWREFSKLVIFIPAILLNIVLFFICETPKFYLQTDLRKVVQSLQYIQKVNNTQDQIEIHMNMFVEKIPISQQSQNIGLQTETKVYSYLDLFRYKSVRQNTIMLVIFSVVVHLVYYGTNFIISRVGLEFQQNLLYIGIAEMVGYFLSERYSDKIRRKLGTIVSFISAIVIMLFNLIFDIPENCQDPHQLCWQKDLHIFMITFARFIISFTFGFIVLWANELFPTTIRSVGMGVFFGIGIIGGFLSPFLVDLSYEIGISPIITIAVIGILGSVAITFLQETFGQEPKDEIEELQVDKNQENNYLQNNQNKNNNNINNENQQQNEKRVINFGPNMKDLVNSDKKNNQQ